MRKYFEMNENGTTTYQNVGAAAQAESREMYDY